MERYSFFEGRELSLTFWNLIILLKNRWFSVEGFNNTRELNFIITSRAEWRVFKPILTFCRFTSQDLIVNAIDLTDFEAEKDFVSHSDDSQIINFTKSIYPILVSQKRSNYLNIICLDHAFFYKQHNLGINIINYLRKNKARTVSIQHGGFQRDNIVGQASSCSEFQIVFGRLMYEGLIKAGWSKEKVYLTGNPLHDKIGFMKKDESQFREKRIISLVTCMHTEYDNRENPIDHYLKYLKNVYSSIDYNKFQLYVKMHPNDSLDPNLYFIARKQLGLTTREIKIDIYDFPELSVYDVIQASQIVISRSSTAIEEALLLNKMVVAYDLFENGPSQHYNYLLKYSNYKRIVEDTTILRTHIAKMSSESSLNSGKLNELIENSTYKLDGRSSERIFKVLTEI